MRYTTSIQPPLQGSNIGDVETLLSLVIAEVDDQLGSGDKSISLMPCREYPQGPSL